MNIGLTILLIVVALILGVVVGVVVTQSVVRKKGELTQEGLQKAIIKAQNQIKESVLSSREQIAKDKEIFERTVNEQKSELKNERDVIRAERLSIKQREEVLDKKEQSLSNKPEAPPPIIAIFFRIYLPNLSISLSSFPLSF